MHSKVFVVDREGKPLLPTHPARARKLLDTGKAAVERVVPFTVRLNRTVENPAGSFTAGVDDGAKYAGIAVVNDKTDEVVFRGTIRLRQDVHRKMTQRAQFRRTRRGRKLRHRKPRFSNRGRKGFLPPTVRQKKESVLRVLNNMKSAVRITGAVVEQGAFDVSPMGRGYELTGKEYQKSEYEGRDFRQKVLWRDRYRCRKCGSEKNLRAHHLKERSRGGTDRVRNGLTLCDGCHTALHRGEWKTEKKNAGTLKYPAHLQQGKHWLSGELEKQFGTVRVCFGWMTADWRNRSGLGKSHSSDAAAMVCRGRKPVMYGKDYLILPKRKKIWEANPTKTCTEKNGFRHYDLIKAEHRTKGTVVGSVRSLKAKSVTLRTPFDDNFAVSSSKANLLYRLGSVVYI
ncbi:MAG: HNH endonuclease [Desulfobacteraceae bacterium]|nr:HNH endonuclease [Desulfobacteraceae bacterium]